MTAAFIEGVSLCFMTPCGQITSAINRGRRRAREGESSVSDAITARLQAEAAPGSGGGGGGILGKREGEARKEGGRKGAAVCMKVEGKREYGQTERGGRGKSL